MKQKQKKHLQNDSLWKTKKRSVMMWRTKLSRLSVPVSPWFSPLSLSVWSPTPTPRLTDRKTALFLYPVPISPLTPNRILNRSQAWMWVTACFTVISGKQTSSSQWRWTEMQHLHLNKPLALLFYSLFNVVCLPVWGYSGPTSFPRGESDYKTYTPCADPETSFRRDTCHFK